MQKERYDHQRIEKKWQEYWEKNNSFRAEIDEEKPKYYVLDMFPYPSGAGLHVGHVTGYTGTDIIARFKRQQGYQVLHPMGWDSFGLPAEQYAIRTGTHPAITTQQNINTYRRQLKSLGFSYDWEREIATSDSTYYKWTQWIFTKLYERGLAYEDQRDVNFCPELGTVLANEEVEDGKSKEGGYPVEKRALRQWVLRITAYAERLIEDLNDLDWPDYLKRLQINWIGKSEGVKISFKEASTKELIEVFTTCPETLFGVTYLVLAPEHPLVSKITTSKHHAEVIKYQEKTANKSDLERTDLAKEKTGAFTGAFAVNPITSEKIPIWIADYVMMGYGTGAVMGVPGHDQRDFEFASVYQLSIKPVIEPDFFQIEAVDKEKYLKEVLEGKQCWSKDGKMINSSNSFISIDTLTVEEAKEKITNYLVKEKIGERKTQYKLRDWLFSRQRYWGEPFPVLHLEDGTKRVLELDELPLLPPHLDDYTPTSSGESPLAKVPKWVYIVDSKTGQKAVREINTMPQWAGSCWYYLRFCDPKNSEKAWGEQEEKYWMPVDLYVGGAEHAVLHLLYSRFWHKVLFDCNLVSTKEPFAKYRNQGLVNARSYKIIGGGYVPEEEVFEKEGSYFHKKTGQELISAIEKMSKSKLNGISPDEIIEEFGADSLRLYEMFMSPFDKEKIWNTDAVQGCKRFLNRFYDLFISDKVTDKDSKEALKLGHRLVEAVTKDIELMSFNTAIAKMMEFINAFSQLDSYPKSVLKMFAQMLNPFAPHITEEVWSMLEVKEPLAYCRLPEVDPKYLVDETANYVIQINGKTRQMFKLEKGKTKDEILEIAKQDPKIAKYITSEITQLIYVQDKLLNIVV